MKILIVAILLTADFGIAGCAHVGMNDSMAQTHGGEGHGQMMQHDMAMEGGEDHGMHQMHYGEEAMAADREAATAVLEAYSAAINEESIESMEALVIADDRFSVIEGRGTDIGWTTYRDHHLGPEFASERIDFHVYGYDNIDVRVGHKFAYATFTYAFAATLDGEPYNKDGRGTAVLQRTPEGWRIRHLQTS